MKKCWFSQVIALSTLYSVLTQSEELLQRHGVRSQATSHDPRSSSADGFHDDDEQDVAFEKDPLLELQESKCQKNNRNECRLATATQSQDWTSESLHTSGDLVEAESDSALSLDRLIQILNEMAEQGEPSLATEYTAAELERKLSSSELRKIAADKDGDIRRRLAERQDIALTEASQEQQGEDPVSQQATPEQSVTDRELLISEAFKPKESTDSQQSFLKQIAKSLDFEITAGMTELLMELPQSQLPGLQSTENTSYQEKRRNSVPAGDLGAGQKWESDLLNISEKDLATFKEKPLMMQRTLAQSKAADATDVSSQAQSAAVSPYLIYMVTPVLLFSVAALYS